MYQNTEESHELLYLAELNSHIEKLPKLIRASVDAFHTREERTNALYAAVVTTGVVMPHVKINYADQINYPALMAIFIYPPASGKGSISKMRKLLGKINRHLIDDFVQRFAHYKAELGDKESGPPTEKPVMPLILTPGNLTAPKLIQQLSHNGEDQILLLSESEIDVFSMSANGSHGTLLSTILRQSFHHEPVSQSRKSEMELLNAETPKLAVILTGTPSQVDRIFTSNEDGLFSRFIVVSGESSPAWRDVRPRSPSRTLDEFFDHMAEEYFRMWQFFQDRKVEVKFTDTQWEQLNAFGTEQLALSYHFTGENSGSVVKRYANMVTRIAAVLTMTQYYEGKDAATNVYCSDAHFEVALWMMRRSLSWSMELYKTLPGRRDGAVAGNKKVLMTELPDRFSLKEIESLRVKLKLSRRTLTRWLKEFTESKLLERTGYGTYQKTSVAQVAEVALSQSDDIA